MPTFIAGTKQAQRIAPLEPLPLELKIRCALADYILNGQEGTLEDRVYGLIAGMPIDPDYLQSKEVWPVVLPTQNPK